MPQFSRRSNRKSWKLSSLSDWPEKLMLNATGRSFSQLATLELQRSPGRSPSDRCPASSGSAVRRTEAVRPDRLALGVDHPQQQLVVRHRVLRDVADRLDPAARRPQPVLGDRGAQVARGGDVGEGRMMLTSASS